MNDYVYNVHGNRVLKWNHKVLSPVNLQTYVDAVTARGAPLPNCFRFIDGTVRPISRPKEHQKFQSMALPNVLSEICMAQMVSYKTVQATSCKAGMWSAFLPVIGLINA